MTCSLYAHSWSWASSTANDPIPLNLRCDCGLISREDIAPLATYQAQIDALRAEVERLRDTLRDIARQATQSIDTQLGGQILRQIEVDARTALEGSRKT